MSFYNVIMLFAGLSLFLYGMNIMGTSLQKATGGTLEKLLNKFTSNIFKSVLLGLFVTAIIQSSTATTVLVVGFVNAGFLTLKQSIGIMMGANIGTTVTAQIIRLSDISSDNFFLSVLNIDNLIPILLIIGIILFAFCKKNKAKDIGQILIGFGLLFLGLMEMKTSITPLANSELFYNILETCMNYPILAFLAGLVITAIIQSSSASVGILQALSSTGAIKFGVIYPIVLGQNIGTSISSMISIIGANKNAKRAALIHLYFNVIGSVLFFIAILILSKFAFFNPILNSVADSGVIANFHTLFNIITTLLLMPFASLLEKLAIFTIKDKDASKENESLLIDDRILVTPTLAISKCNKIVNEMAEIAFDNYLNSVSLFYKYDEKLEEQIYLQENKLDEIQDTLEKYLTKIIDKELSNTDSKKVYQLSNVITEFERIGDYSINLLEQAKIMSENGCEFSETAKRDFNVLTNVVEDILKITISSFKNNDMKEVNKIEPLEEVIDTIIDRLKAKSIKNFKSSDKYNTKLIFLELLVYLERISDHCSNIAIYIISFNDGLESINRHEYIRQLHTSETEEYTKYINDFSDKYLSLIEK